MIRRNLAPIGIMICLSAVFLIPASAAADGPYVSFLVGGVNTKDVEADGVEVEFDTGFAFAGQFGYNFNNFRLGGELGYQVADGESDNDVRSEVDVTRFTINGYIDLPIAEGAGPYIGGGFGVANLRTGDDLSDDFEDEDTAFTWHGEAGLKVALNNRFSVAPTYRYQWIDSDIGGQTEPLISHIFGISLHYQFYSRHHSGRYSSDSYSRSHGYYGGGYSSYGSRSRYDRFDHYDDHRYRYRHKTRQKTPEQLERNRCGWKGPGCEDEFDGD